MIIVPRTMVGMCIPRDVYPIRARKARKDHPVSPAQFSSHDITNLLVRRKKLIKVSFSVVFLLSTLCAFILPRKYESSITILVQRDETLNPLVSYEMAVS